MNVEVNKNELGSSEKSLEVAQEVRFRCPHCQKLYCTSGDAFTGLSPIFDCLSCKKTFRLLNAVNEFGLHQTESTVHHQMSICPKCSFFKPQNQDECPSCGVLASKYEALQKVESPSLFELNKKWSQVLSDFESDQFHQNFIGACQQKMALNYAFKKYADLKQTVGLDSLCEKYMRQIETRLEQQLKNESPPSPFEEEAKQALIQKRTQRFFLTVGVIGLSLLILNKLRPTFPNLNGLIVAITLLSFGLMFVADQKKIFKS